MQLYRGHARIHDLKDLVSIKEEITNHLDTDDVPMFAKDVD